MSQHLRPSDVKEVTVLVEERQHIRVDGEWVNATVGLGSGVDSCAQVR